MGKKKQLSIGVDAFYVYCALHFGAPNELDLIAHKFKHYEWFVNSTRAEQFTQCVTSCGEASSRAVYWYRRYLKWHAKQRGKHK